MKKARVWLSVYCSRRNRQQFIYASFFLFLGGCSRLMPMIRWGREGVYVRLGKQHEENYMIIIWEVYVTIGLLHDLCYLYYATPAWRGVSYLCFVTFCIIHTWLYYAEDVRAGEEGGVGYVHTWPTPVYNINGVVRSTIDLTEHIRQLGP